MNSEPTPEPNSPPPSPLPVFLWLLMGFLLADTGLRIYSVMVTGTFAPTPGGGIEEHFLHLVTSTISVLLILMILVRSIAARIWGTVYFVLQVLYFVAKYGILRPEQWLAATDFERSQVIVRLLFFTVATVLLNLPPVSRALETR